MNYYFKLIKYFFQMWFGFFTVIIQILTSLETYLKNPHRFKQKLSQSLVFLNPE